MTAELFPFIPAAFPALAFAHFLSLLSPGPDFFLIIGHAVRHRFRGTAFICAGIALGNVLYIVLAIMGWSVLRHAPLLFRCMELAGGVFLAWLGWALLRSSQQAVALTIHDSAELSPVRQLLTGLASALLNPKNALFYLTLMSVILGSDVSLAQQVFAGTWMALLVLAWDMGLAALISLPGMRQKLGAAIPYVERTAGIVLMALGTWLAFAPLVA